MCNHRDAFKTISIKSSRRKRGTQEHKSESVHATKKKEKKKTPHMLRWLENHMVNRKALRKMSELFKGLGSNLIRTLLDKEAF